MKKLLLVVVFLSIAPSCFAQLTQEQKVNDFKALAGLYDKNYGPYEWKKEVFGFDLLRIQPWLDEVRESRSDLAFYDICVRYTASLHDSHDEFILPSIYEAYLPITADIYDGKVLIDFVDTFSLDPATFPINVGDELLSVNGISMDTWINVLGAYSVNGNGNHVSRDRLAVATTLDRYQGWYTFASKIQPGDFATIVVKSAGKRATFSIPWQTIFLPLLEEGPVPNPKGFSSLSKFATPKARSIRSMKERGVALKNPWHTYSGEPGPRMARMKAATSATGATGAPAATSRRRLRQFSAVHADHVLAGGLKPFGSFVPLFNPPPGFQLRLGAGAEDEFLSGTFPVGNKLIDFIRISSFEPFSEANAVSQFQADASFFQANTDGLVVDLMNNGGGSICYANLLLQSVIPQDFQPLRAQIRATEVWIQDLEISLIEAELFGASQETINVLADALEQVQQALAQKRGLTPPLDVFGPAGCFLTGGALYPPATDADGNNIAYTKPIVVLTNNFTLSAAELFSATLQDAKRATVYGTRTDGGGGNVVGFDSTPYSEGFSRVTHPSPFATTTFPLPAFPVLPILKTSASILMSTPTTRLATIFSTAELPSSTASPTSSTG